MLNPFTIVVRALAFLTAIPFHEAAHAYISDKLGDPTAKNMGRLTLNPLAHFDLMGGLCMLLTGIGWAKPVPINTYNFKSGKKGMAISAAAGPLSNILLGFITLVLAKVVLYTSVLLGVSGSVSQTLITILTTMTSINISLAIFNLLPIPPFDGSRIFSVFLPERIYFKIMQYEQYIFLGVFALLMFGFLDGPLSYFTGLLYNLLYSLSGFVDVLFRLLM